ncbi:MAG: diguanylate cyclase [Geobacter sp.]|nr:diguanylate cyclase [Geobacter sp.]
MTTHNKKSQIRRGDHSVHFEQIASDRRLDGNLLMPEYRLLYDEYCGVKRRLDLLEKEKSSLNDQLAEMNRSLERAGRTDPMTGLASRRDVMEKIEREYSRAERHGRTFSVILADLDNFKRVNDLYGFNAGDDVLVEVARVLMGCIRNEDVCARWGGEEFLFLLSETDIEGAETVARKVHESIMMTEFKAHKPGIRITVSLGLSELRHGQTLYECVTRADHALQYAKQGGKNRYFVDL